MADEKRFVYQVELDIKKVAGQVEQLRKLLADIFESSAGSGQKADPVERMAGELKEVARLDLTKSTEELQRELQQAEKDAQRLNDQLERMSLKGGFAGGGKSARSNALFDDVIDKVRRELGDEQANISAYTGALPPGARGGEFLSGTAADLGGADAAGYLSEAQGGFKEIEEKRRRTAEEIQQEAALTAELYETQIKGSQAQQEITRREQEELAGLITSLKNTEAGPMISADEIQGDLQNLQGEYALNREALELMMEEEADLAQSLAVVKEQQAKELQKAQQAAARAKAKQAGTIAPASAVTPGASKVYTQQTAITVTKAAVANAQELTKALEQAAEASERLAANNNRGIDKQRQQDELELLRKKLKLERDGAEATAKAAAEATEAAKKSTNARKAQEDRVTINARAEAQKRIEAVRQENRLATETARQTTKRLAEEERRRTAQVIAENKKQASTRQQAASGKSLATLGKAGLAAVGVYSVDQVARQFYQEGSAGAQQLRAAETFDFLAERANISADEILAAVDRASAGTVDDMTAMTLSAQLLAQRFANTSTDIVGDTETLVSASRRFSQIYVDESGAFLSTAEVYSRLIKFIREGNKELVDQFGLSNQAIASFLGVSVDGLASAEGAALRMKGVVGILEQEVARLGASENTLADQIEASEARITESRNRLRQALAAPVANVAEGLADTVELLQISFGGGDLDLLTDQLYRLQEATGGFFQRQKAIDAEKEALGRLAEGLKAAEEAQRSNVDGADEYGQTLESVARNILSTGQIQAGHIAIIDQTTEALGRATYAAFGYSGALGSIDASTPTSVYNPLRDKYSGSAPTDSWVDTMNTQEERDTRYYQMQVDRLEEQRALDKRNAEQAQREWEQAAKQAEAEFKAAAAAVEAEFKSIAGLFGTTDVSEEDMAKAKAGIYEEKPDEYLRQLRDEVKNKKDYEGVSIEDAAKRLGADASLSADAILLLFEEAWADSSLFADGQNLDLINRDAVERELKRIEESKAGQAAILEFFGISTAQQGTAAIASAAGAAIANELGAGGTLAPAGTAEATGAARDADAGPIGERLRAEIIGGMLGDEITASSPLGAFIAKMRSELDGEAAGDIVAQARGIGTQLQNYIGSGLIDMEAQPTLAAVFTDELSRSFLAAEQAEKAAAAGRNLRAGIAFGFMDPATLPDFAGNLAGAITTQLYRDDVSERVQALGSALLGLAHAGWVNGADDYDWIGPIASAAYDQAAADQAEATAAAFGPRRP